MLSHNSNLGLGLTVSHIFKYILKSLKELKESGFAAVFLLKDHYELTVLPAAFWTGLFFKTEEFENEMLKFGSEIPHKIACAKGFVLSVCCCQETGTLRTWSLVEGC